MTTLLPRETIQQMDGPALTKLAWEMELDPHDIVKRRRFSWQQRSWGEAAIDACGEIWRPHERLDQADAVFRQLRARGWETLVNAGWYDGLDPHPIGKAEATHLASAVTVCRFWSTHPARFTDSDASEAMALLRCAVLAVYWEGAEKTRGS